MQQVAAAPLRPAAIPSLEWRHARHRSGWSPLGEIRPTPCEQHSPASPTRPPPRRQRLVAFTSAAAFPGVSNLSSPTSGAYARRCRHAALLAHLQEAAAGAFSYFLWCYLWFFFALLASCKVIETCAPPWWLVSTERVSTLEILIWNQFVFIFPLQKS